MRPPFAPGNPGGPGRPAGVRNRLSRAILEDLLADWREHGAKAIKLMRIERPADYVKAAISTLPKELLFDHSATSDMTDEQLDDVIDQIKRHLLTIDSPLMIEGKVEHEKAK